MSSVSDRPLHCLSSAPRSQAGQRLLAMLEPQDDVLLLGKAVVLAGITHPDIQEWVASGAQLHALEEDLRAYGARELHPSIVSTDYAGWVRLSENHQTQVLWR
ncbi:sulfurtransferase complex subunit TusB [Congregibacter litoralis]|uniref:Sulfur relay protein TusB/DsrH n=1 Tax=Congregibacter litoralis KT71 TaxID=314285 RepID=A4A8C9_9GAMM|nr:sulfurtransferase complex subunit TusB [Congregibacter litoralis]EAQ97924.2 sulfur relay protein TusB/DsrH [Congregibacter litoralis KT71]